MLDKSESLDAFLPEELHSLVYSVGSITLKPFSRITDTDFLKEYQLNVIGAAMVIQQALKSLKSAQGASIVSISSIEAKTWMGFHTSFSFKRCFRRFCIGARR